MKSTMFEITHKHLELITADVDKSDISYSHLKYDLIDHICCDLEYEMNQGLTFETAYEKVKKRIGIRGLQQIQEDTLFLIDKKYRTMKKTMKTFGVIAPILMSIGSLFKIEHWPGASVLLTLGFFLLCFVFLPSAVYVSYRELTNRKKLLAHISGFLAAFLFAAGFLFKIQHWPWSGIMIVAASAVAAIGFIPSFYISRIKECPRNEKFAYVIGFIGSFGYLTGFLFKINHWPGASILLLTGTLLLLLIAFPLLIFLHYKNFVQVSSRFIFLCLAIVWFILPTTLISMNISKDVLYGFRTNVLENEYVVKYLTSRNQKLAAQTVSSSNVINARSKSDELVNYVQSLKDKMLSLSAGRTTDASSVNFDQIDLGDKKSVDFVLRKDNGALELQNKLNDYRLSFVEKTEIDSASAKIISGMLETISMKEENWQYVSLISALNKLSKFQETIRNAEGIALRSLKKSSDKKLIAASK